LRIDYFLKGRKGVGIWEVQYIYRKEVEIREQDVDRGKGDEGEGRGEGRGRGGRGRGGEGGGSSGFNYMEDLHGSVYCTTFNISTNM
jgi:hypothetical protein